MTSDVGMARNADTRVWPLLDCMQSALRVLSHRIKHCIFVFKSPVTKSTLCNRYKETS